MRILSLMFVAAIAVVGCDKTGTVNSDGGTPPDNAAVNQRDQDGATKTPLDQGQNQPDIDRTAEIRKRVTGEPGLSVSARNVKIITENGKVTLRGPVASQEEKDTIDKIAKEVAGTENVDNQIEIAP